MGQTINIGAEVVYIQSALLFFDDTFEVCKTKICYEKIQVIDRSAVLSSDENISRFDILVPSVQ